MADSTQTAQTYINKLNAAQRQLDAAIRMVLIGEDELAIHTIAAAAFQIVRDLKGTTRQRSEVIDSYRRALLYLARDYASGKITNFPEYIQCNEDIASFLKSLVERTKELGRLPEEGDIDVSISFSEGDYWHTFNEPANFLKHARDDPRGLLAEEKVDPSRLILQACVAFTDLMPQPTSEMIVYHIYHGARTGFTDGMREPFKAMAEGMTTIPEDERRTKCLRYLEAYKASSKAKSP